MKEIEILQRESCKMSYVTEVTEWKRQEQQVVFMYSMDYVPSGKGQF